MTTEMATLPAKIVPFHVHDRQLEDARVKADSQPWQVLPGFLTVEEVTASSPSPLPLNDIMQPYSSKQEYLGILYALTRFEASEPLRHVIQAYRAAGFPTDEFFIYSKVFVKGYILRPLGAFARLSFSTEELPEDLDWQQCKLLKHGTLVALAPAKDRFREHCILAIIIDNRTDDTLKSEDADRPTIIDVMWTSTETAIVDSQEYVMIEAKNGYFESKLHTLIGLQHAALETSKFDRYLVEADPVVRQWPASHTLKLPEGAKTFDESQREAFDVMTSREMALVQGPPGTGKTFTTVAALEYLVNMSDSHGHRPPIIVASQTNHAADQLLRLCLERDIGTIVRLGGQSKSEAIKELSMFNLRSTSKFKGRNKRARHAQEDVAASLKSCLDDMFYTEGLPAQSILDEGLITRKQFESLALGDGDEDWCDNSNPDDDQLAKWLGKGRNEAMAQLGINRNDSEFDEDLEFTQDDDLGDGPGEFVLMKHSLAGEPHDSTIIAAKRELQRNSNLWFIKPRRRWMVYEYLHHMMRQRAATRFRMLLEKYDTATKDVKIGRWESDCRIIQKEGIQIIGCTTTGLSKYRGFLAALQPKTLMIEEAAETQEAYVSAALYPSLERIVLVGDHQQLAPHVDVRLLGEDPYHLNVSLFERLVSKVGLPYAMLKVQRRMAPDIREIVQTFYPLLRDHESVMEREPIPGMGTVRLWWFQHSWPESRNKDMSYLNPDEASMILYFIKHLLRNGLEPRQVTVLSYYNGQVDLIKSRLQQDEELAAAYPTHEWSVRTVDGFQGEENEVVILSIVRGSNMRYNAGFVSDENRAVVAVSRARRGCYIFGNSQNLLQANEDSRQTWQKVIDVLSIRRNIGEWLPIQCTRHKNKVEIEDVEEWFELQGGCRVNCDGRCSKGHSCRLKCHPLSTVSCICAEEKCPGSNVQRLCRQEQVPNQEAKLRSRPKGEQKRTRLGQRLEETSQWPAEGRRTATTTSSSSRSSRTRLWVESSQRQQVQSQAGPPTTASTSAKQVPAERAKGEYDLMPGDQIREIGYEEYERSLELRARRTQDASTERPAVTTNVASEDTIGILIDFEDNLCEEDNSKHQSHGNEEDLISFEVE